MVLRANTSVLLLLAPLVLSAVVGAKAARDAHQKSNEILRTLERIEEKLNREERLREITGLVHLEATLERISAKVDRVIDHLEGGADGSPPSQHARLSDSPAVALANPVPRDVSGRLKTIDESLERLEASMVKVERVLSEADFQKLDELEKSSSKLHTDLNLKLRKMMNIITALYEMNKEIKTNFGGRIETPTEHQTPQSSSYAAEFLIENLEELERKIKEQFSVLTNEIRTEITGLKIVASSVSGGCAKSTDLEDDYGGTPFDEPKQPNSNKRSSARNENRISGRSYEVLDNSTLDTIVQSLDRSTMEIREEIHQGIQAIDHKLSNMTKLHCNDLQPAASVSQPVRVAKEIASSPGQRVAAKRSRKAEKCTKTANDVDSPSSCAELRIGGATCDGVYVVFPQKVRALRVYCDMTVEGGGWTVLMRRGDFGDKMTTFHKNWLSYKNGFGDVEGEFWLGNDVMHLLSSQDDNVLRVNLEAFDGENVNLTYSSFSVADEKDNYRLQIGPALSTPTPVSNGLRYHNNHPFSTFDRKNDPFEQNCAATYKGGWWFNGCYFGFLTGEYFRPDDKREGWQGMLWYDWKGNASLKGAAMMVRPKSFKL